MKKKIIFSALFALFIAFVFLFPLGMNDDFHSNTSFYMPGNEQKRNFDEVLYRSDEVNEWLITDHTPKDFTVDFSLLSNAFKRENKEKKFQEIKIDSTAETIYSENRATSATTITYQYILQSDQNIAEEHASVRVVPNGYETIVDINYIYDFSHSNFFNKTFGKWSCILNPSAKKAEIDQIKSNLKNHLKKETES